MENDNHLKRMERVLIRIFLVLSIVVICGIVLLIRLDTEEPSSTEEKQVLETQQDDYVWENGLSDSTLWLPDKCGQYEKIPDIRLEDAEGKEHLLSEYAGRKTVLVFWASWCEDCQKQMPHMKDYMKIANAIDDIQFIFVNKTDGQKETRESAISYFDTLDIKADLMFDYNLYAYDALGMHNIPTTYFLDEEGVIISWAPKQIESESVFQAYIQDLVNGNSDATLQFIKNNLIDSEGAVHSRYEKSEEETWKSDVLSESQGLMMQYAVLKQDKELFDTIYQYTKSHMLLSKGLVSWMVQNGKASEVNALLDDIRIYQAVDCAQELWGGYDEEVSNLTNRFIQYGINKNGDYIDFYDSDSEQKASRLTLCYIDLATMKHLADENKQLEQAYLSADQILKNGQISETFPLYYSWYNYEKAKYEEDDLNMAEELVTILHLAQIGELPDNTLEWIKSHMNSTGIKARYDVNGQVVDGYNYDSTAVYALVVRIAQETGENELKRQAIRKMEKMRIQDSSLAYNGAFGMEDGSEIYSFDQIVPLLTYGYLEEE